MRGIVSTCESPSGRSGRSPAAARTDNGEDDATAGTGLSRGSTDSTPSDHHDSRARPQTRRPPTPPPPVPAPKPAGPRPAVRLRKGPGPPTVVTVQLAAGIQTLPLVSSVRTSKGRRPCLAAVDR